MIEWQDDAIILSARPQGETAALVSLLTRHHGRHLGIVHGGQSRSKAALLQPGQQVCANWRARLGEQLGTFTLESTAAWPAALMEDARALSGLSAACAMLDATLAEREPHVALYDGFLTLVSSFEMPDIWPFIYVKWELGLLSELGYGVNLSACAVTGETKNLTHVSPKTGRAVCAEIAAPYKEKLLPLPVFLQENFRKETGYIKETGVPSSACPRELFLEEIHAGLRLCGYFLAQHVFSTARTPLPPARQRLADLFAQTPA